jgi:hypothetical protein
MTGKRKNGCASREEQDDRQDQDTSAPEESAIP